MPVLGVMLVPADDVVDSLIERALTGDHLEGFPDDVLDVLYARADKAMYRCKLLGRNRWAIFEPTDEETPLLPRP